MTYTPQQLQQLRDALARGERRVSFGDRQIEYRSTEELMAAIAHVERALAATAGPRPRRLHVTTSKGF